MTGPAAKALKEMRERAGFTVRGLARELGYGEAFSTYSSYELTYKRAFLPPEIVQKLVKIFPGRGDPPIKENEVLALGGLTQKDGLRPKSAPLNHSGSSNLSIKEVDVESSAGPGSDDFRLDGDGQHRVLATWQMPESYLRSVSESAEAIRIIRVVGDSMEPDFFSGERVMVDTAHYLPSPPAVYVLFDGIGLYIKQLELIEGSNPLRVRVSSRNPAYAPYEKDLSEIRINGRVMGKWTWK